MVQTRRQLLQSAALGIGGAFLLRQGSAVLAQEVLQPDTTGVANWAGNVVFTSRQVHRPKTTAEVQALVRNSRRAKGSGTEHSFSRCHDTPGGDQISTVDLKQIVRIDRGRRQLVVQSGAKYGDVVDQLHQAGLAFPNLASLPHISIGGAVATGTHGSGDQNGNLSTHVSAMELVTGAGEVLRLSREKDGDRFLGAVVNLGTLGIVTELTIDCLPAFDLAQTVYVEPSFEQIAANFNEVMAAGYSVSIFTKWEPERAAQIWVKSKTGAGAFKAPATWMGGTKADRHVHPVITQSADPCTRQMGEAGPWHDRLCHFRMGFKPSTGAERQSEFFVPRARAVEAMRALREIGKWITPNLLMGEIRSIKGDEFWMSPAQGGDMVAFHFTWKPDDINVLAALELVELALAPFGARPHMAKITVMGHSRLSEVYPKLGDFAKLAAELDPEGKFRNPFVSRYIFGQ